MFSGISIACLRRFFSLVAPLFSPRCLQTRTVQNESKRTRDIEITRMERMHIDCRCISMDRCSLMIIVNFPYRPKMNQGLETIGIDRHVISLLISSHHFSLLESHSPYPFDDLTRGWRSRVPLRLTQYCTKTSLLTALEENLKISERKLIFASENRVRGLFAYFLPHFPEFLPSPPTRFCTKTASACNMWNFGVMQTVISRYSNESCNIPKRGTSVLLRPPLLVLFYENLQKTV